jgi:hypothetical protein
MAPASAAAKGLTVTRTERHAAVSAALTALSDTEIDDLLATGTPLGTGIGGVTVLVHAAGAPVFVKRVPLTVLESAHPRSTANLYRLPTFLQYGVGSPGFSAWRELEAHEVTTAAVLAGSIACFPLLYHWRIQPRVPAAVADLDEDDVRWRDLPSARARVRALEQATSCLVLFLEYAPVTLLTWLAERPLEQSLPLAERGLLAAAQALADNGLLHLDAHLNNIVCDGDRLLLTDFGLVTSAQFQLDEQEREFVARHVWHDRADLMTRLVNWAVRSAVPGVETAAARNDWIRQWPGGEDVPPVLRDLLDRWAGVAVVVNDFYWRLYAGDLLTPYPEAEIARALRHGR